MRERTSGSGRRVGDVLVRISSAHKREGQSGRSVARLLAAHSSGRAVAVGFDAEAAIQGEPYVPWTSLHSLPPAASVTTGMNRQTKSTPSIFMLAASLER